MPTGAAAPEACYGVGVGATVLVAVGNDSTSTGRAWIKTVCQRVPRPPFGQVQTYVATARVSLRSVTNAVAGTVVTRQ